MGKTIRISDEAYSILHLMANKKSRKGNAMSDIASEAIMAFAKNETKSLFGEISKRLERIEELIAIKYASNRIGRENSYRHC